MLGGNGMGFVNLGPKLYATGFPTPDDLEPGGVTLLSHSGSVFSAFLFNDRGSGSTCSCRAGRRSSRRWTSTSPTRSTCRRPRSWACCSRRSDGPRVSSRRWRRPRSASAPVFALKVGRTEVRRRWWSRTRARSPASTARTRRCSTRTGSTRAATSRRWRTRSSCSSRRAASRPAPAWRRSTTPAASGRSSSTSAPTSASRSRMSPTGPARRSTRCSTRGSWPTTRWTRGGPASTPTGSTARASRRCTTIPRRPRSRSSWTSPGRASRTTRAICRSRATSGRRRRSRSA